MDSIVQDLDELVERGNRIYSIWNRVDVNAAVDLLMASAVELEASHCGSWLGYHSLVYYEDFQKPPAGAHFDRQRGLMSRLASNTLGDWVECSYDDLFNALKRISTKPTYDELMKLSREHAEETDDLRDDIIAAIEAATALKKHDFLTRLAEDANNARMRSASTIAKASMPPISNLTLDSKAACGGIQIPPHAAFKANIASARSLFESTNTLAKIAKRASTYLSRQMEFKDTAMQSITGSRVFIGHGRSSAWLELKNYIQDRLGLPCDDFNREATAGRTNIARLEAMLDDSCFAFLVLTSEDVQNDQEIRARQNVVHEAGLFQGRLGFEKAIIMLENGCEEFSNINGLGQIRFASEGISGAFHEVQDTLKREGLL